MALAAANLHALLETIGNGTLAALLALRESGTAAKRTSTGGIAHTNNAHAFDAGNLSITCHARGHLDLDGVISIRYRANTGRAGDVTNDGCRLERAGIRAAGSAVDGSIERAGAIFIDLKKWESSAPESAWLLEWKLGYQPGDRSS